MTDSKDDAVEKLARAMFDDVVNRVKMKMPWEEVVQGERVWYRNRARFVLELMKETERQARVKEFDRVQTEFVAHLEGWQFPLVGPNGSRTIFSKIEAGEEVPPKWEGPKIGKS